MKIGLVVVIFFAFASPAWATDISMLKQWTPADLSTTDPVALSYLAQGWAIAGLLHGPKNLSSTAAQSIVAAGLAAHWPR